MPSIKQVEAKIEKVEGFQVRILHGRDRRDVRSDKRGIAQYKFARALKGSKNVSSWRADRFAKKYPGFDVQVLDAGDRVVHGRTLLTTFETPTSKTEPGRRCALGS